MIGWLRDRPIRQKLMALGLMASAGALVVASAVFLITTYLVARRQTHDALVAQATIASDNISAALDFADPDAANDTLQALRAMPSIDIACAWDTDGTSFASYEPQPDVRCPDAPPGDVDVARPRQLEIGRTVRVAGRRVGTLYIRANLRDVDTRMQSQGLATLAALLFGALGAIASAAALQRMIAEPITALAATSHDITEHGDYSVRVASTAGRDELGDLVIAFNNMLQEIQRRDDELRTANRLKDEFLATVSHELRTPLNAILGWLQILQMTPPSEQRLQQALKSLDRNARAQARLVEDVLDVSRIVAGKLRLKMDIIDVTQVVEAANDVMRPTAEAKGLAFEARLDPSPHYVKGDPDRLQQAVWNLLANAVKFTDAGGRITISLNHTSTEVLVAVEDTGVGIDPAFLPHVFEPFRQADASSTRQHPGLGLGLAIVRDVMEAHGGHIDAFSAGRGRGARFVLRLPRVYGTSTADTPMSRRLAVDKPLAGCSVLVVDDDADARELTSAALSAAGATALTAADVATAVQHVRKSAVHVIVADLAMPGVDGYGLFEQLRDVEIAQRRLIPAILLTAHASAEEESRALATGFFGFLRKPFRFEELVELVLSASRSVPRQTPRSEQRPS